MELVEIQKLVHPLHHGGFQLSSILLRFLSLSDLRNAHSSEIWGQLFLLKVLQVGGS
jgi:hypothetical protein